MIAFIQTSRFLFEMALLLSILGSKRITFEPFFVPTTTPTIFASATTTSNPSTNSANPSSVPSSRPTSRPTVPPSLSSSSTPTQLDSSHPSTTPTASSVPTSVSSSKPSSTPTSLLSQVPTSAPSTSSPPTVVASNEPSSSPTNLASFDPSSSPTVVLSEMPTNAPSTSSSPTTLASNEPSSKPSVIHSARPSLTPSSSPINIQSVQPSSHVTNEPSIIPTISSNPTSCTDSNDSFEVETFGLGETRDCQWVANSVSRRCYFAIAQEKCPSTCVSCECKDNPGEFLTNEEDPESGRDCLWALGKASRCNNSNVVQNCPWTCGTCNAPSSSPSQQFHPSASPSIVQSTTPTSVFSHYPSNEPTHISSQKPSRVESVNPTSSQMPTISISQMPSAVQSVNPTTVPTSSQMPTSSPMPSRVESVNPTAVPTSSYRPTAVASFSPSSKTKTAIEGSLQDQSSDDEDVRNSRTLYNFIGGSIVGCVFVSLLIVLFIKQRNDKKSNNSRETESEEDRQDWFVPRYINKPNISFSDDDEWEERKERNGNRQNNTNQRRKKHLLSIERTDTKDTLDLIMESQQTAFNNQFDYTEGHEPDTEQIYKYSRSVDENGDTSGLDQIHIFEIDCPPGPLGLIISTCEKGPFVKDVKISSPLLGVIIPGDVIIHVDKTETISMTGPELKSHLGKKSLMYPDTGLKLTVMRDPEV